MIKKLSTALLALCLALSLAAPASAAGAAITIDGVPVQFTESSGSPFIDENDRTLVPLRVTMETYGCEVFWDNENRNGVVYKDGVTVVCPIGENRFIVNGESISIDTAAVIVDSRTYLPIRAVLEAMGASVGWDGSTYTGIISRGNTDVLLHQQSYIDRANDAISANPYLSEQDAADVKYCTEMYLRNITADEAQISKMCQRLSLLKMQHGATPGGVGYCETYDNRNYVITIAPDDPNDAMIPSEVLFHELCHMFANMPNTSVWFQEGMTSLFTLSVAGSGSWDLYSYDAYLRTITALMELVGKDAMTSAYLTGNQSSITNQIAAWSGNSNAASVINDCAERMTSALSEGLFFWMGQYSEANYSSAKAKYESAAATLKSLIEAAWQGKNGAPASSDPLISAYLDLLGRFEYVSEGRLIIDPSFAYGTNYNYYGRSDYESFFILMDDSRTYCEDGELVYYRYAA